MNGYDGGESDSASDYDGGESGCESDSANGDDDDVTVFLPLNTPFRAHLYHRYLVPSSALPSVCDSTTWTPID